MILLVIWITLCKAKIIDVDFSDSNIWSSSQRNIENCTFKISSSREKYIYVDVLLPLSSSNLLLVAQELKAVSNFSGSFQQGSTVDMISVLENRRTRFLKIKQSNFPLYISTFDSSSKLSYKITIENSSDEKCDNDCSYDGICNEDGCECKDETVGNDCHIQATQIFESDGQELILYEDPIYFYIQLDDYKDKSLTLKVALESDNDNDGIFVYVQKSEAIYIPNSENYNQNLLQQEQVYESKPLNLQFDVPVDIEDDTRLVFAAIWISQNLYNVGSTLDISLKIQESSKSTTVSSLVIIIVVVSIVVAIVIVITLYCIFKNVRRRRLIEYAARQRYDLNQGQNKQPTDHGGPILIEIYPSQVNPDESCSICLENLGNGKQLSQTLCKHNFHNECILAWAAKHQECPICRCNLVTKQA